MTTMKERLEERDFLKDELEGCDCTGFIQAKYRALAILHDCPDVVAPTEQIFNQLVSLPDIADLIFRHAKEAEWLACAIKALMDGRPEAQLERYVSSCLEHAGRALKYRQGYQTHVKETNTVREQNRKKAVSKNAAKGKSTREKIIACHEKLLKKRGVFHGLDAAVAKEVGVTPARVSQVLSSKR